MKVGVNHALKAIDTAEMAAAVHSMPIRWMKCVKAQGEYFEGWHLTIDLENDHGLIMFLDDSEGDQSDAQTEETSPSESEDE